MKQKFNTFVRNNTEYIREGLRKLGIPQNDFDDGDRPWIAVNHGMWISVDEGHDRLFPDDIDCGDNADLFLAIAALRDDTDFGQWFKIPKIKTLPIPGYCGQQGMNGYQRQVISVEYHKHDKHDTHISDIIKFDIENGEQFVAKKLTVDELKLWFNHKLMNNDYKNDPVIKEYTIEKRDKITDKKKRDCSNNKKVFSKRK